MPNKNHFKTNLEYNLWYKEYRAKNRIKIRAYNRAYNQKYREKNGFKNEEKWKKNNPQKIKVENLLNYAVKCGKIKRQPCEVCGKKKTHGHHPDYAIPFLVNWLCPIHHKAIHILICKQKMEE